MQSGKKSIIAGVKKYKIKKQIINPRSTPRTIRRLCFNVSFINSHPTKKYIYHYNRWYIIVKGKTNVKLFIAFIILVNKNKI